MTGKRNGRQQQQPKNFTVKDIQPLTDSQKSVFDKFKHSDHLILHGSAGTGKTFLALALALKTLLNKKENVKQIIIIRSSAQTREQGHLPGTAEEKMAEFEKPYRALFTTLLGRGDSYEVLKKQNAIAFESTSFLRGMTYDDSVIIVDEAQNLTFHELDTVITRVGENTRLLICGDTRQNDLAHKAKRETSGLNQLLYLTRHIDPEYIDDVEFTSDDIVRSEFVKQYIIAKEMVC